MSWAAQPTIIDSGLGRLLETAAHAKDDFVSLLPALDVPLATGDARLPSRRIADQGEVNACFSCALATCLEARDPAMPALSARFHFHYAAQLWPGAADRGISDETIAYGALREHGISAARLHPYPITRANVDRNPSSVALSDAATRIPKMNDNGQSPWAPQFSGPMCDVRCKAALARRQPVLLILYTNHAYWDLNNGGVDTWKSTDREIGSQLHAAAIIGSSEERQAFIVQDSRGPGFGVGGQWFLPYELAGGAAIEASFTLEYEE